MSTDKSIKAVERTQHTPGPWVVFAGTIIQDEKERTIVALDESHACGLDFYEIRSNARLIAAAPELLASLREMCAALEDTNSGAYRTLADAKAAIAKAEGR